MREERRQGLQLARLVRFIENGKCPQSDILSGGTRAGTIRTPERSPDLQGGVNEEETRGQGCTVIPPPVASWAQTQSEILNGGE